jgi:hypothetical protein
MHSRIVFLSLFLASWLFAFTNVAVAACGLVGCVLEWTGDRTGIPPIKKAGKEADNASRDVKKNTPGYSEAEGAVSRPVREGFKWIEKNPDKAIIIAVVVAGGWAACIGGCTFIAGLTVTGEQLGATGGAISIPILVYQSGEEQRRTRTAHGAPPSRTTHSDAPSPIGGTEKQLPDVGSFEKDYPQYYSKVTYPNGLWNSAPKITYNFPGQGTRDRSQTFAWPSPEARPRVPTLLDKPGGLFLSPRQPLNPDAKSLYGKDTSRVHGGTDWLIAPGRPIYATVSGVVGKFARTETGFPIITISASDGTRGRLLYVQPSVRPGERVVAGQTVVGRSMDLWTYKGYAQDKVPNHVHADFIDRKGRKFDPYTNMTILREEKKKEAKK